MGHSWADFMNDYTNKIENEITNHLDNILNDAVKYLRLIFENDINKVTKRQEKQAMYKVWLDRKMRRKHIKGRFKKQKDFNKRIG